MTGRDLNGVIAVLDAAQPLPEQVDLTASALTPRECAALVARYPDVHFHYTATLWGVTVRSEDTEATFEGNELVALDELSALLDCMPQLRSVSLYDKRIRLSHLADLYAAHPDVFFGLTIPINPSHVIRTDWTAYSTLGRQPQVTPPQMQYFSYMKNLRALDVGHMTILKLDFLEQLPPLKILIVADCTISDLSPIACQTELEYLEIFKNDITDLSPLSGLTELRDLNIGYNQITDLSPLYDLPNLERLWTMGNWYIPEEEFQRFREHQPDCELVTWSYGATGNIMDENKVQTPGTSWRHHKHYDTIYWIFHHNAYIDWDVEVPQIKGIEDM